MSNKAGIDWPAFPDATSDSDQLELKKLLYQAQLQAATAQQAAIIERDKAVRANYDALHQAVFNAYLDVAKGVIDRAVARAEFVEKAAGTIAGAYGAALTLSFSISKDAFRPLPIRGLAPTIFLGLAIVLATGYLAYMTRSHQVTRSTPQAMPLLELMEERNTFIRWVSNTVLYRVLWLQSAVISLGFGILFLPVAFLDIKPDQDNFVWLAVAVSLVITLLVPPIVSLFMRQKAADPSLQMAKSS